MALPNARRVREVIRAWIALLLVGRPSRSSVDPKERAFTYWAGANADMAFSEHLIDVGSLPPTGAFYIFLNTKVENTHGGPGRAIAILPTGGAGMKQAQ